MVKSRLAIFDYTRALALVIMCGAHTSAVMETTLPGEIYRPTVHQFPYLPMSLGLYSLNVFIFISGFLAFRSVFKLDRPSEIANLMVRRFLRIYLPFFIFIIAFWLIIPQWASPLVHHLTFTSNLISIEDLKAPWLWYIALDFQLHLIFIPVFFFLRKLSSQKQAIILLCLMVLGFLIRYFISEMNDVSAAFMFNSYREDFIRYYNLIHLPPWSRFIPFIAGAFTSVAITFTLSRPQKVLSLIISLFLMLVMATKADFSLNDNSWMHDPWWIAATDLVVAMATILLFMGLKDMRFPENSFIRWFGQLGLGVYIFHIFMIVLLFNWRPPMMWYPPLEIILLWLLSMTASLPLAWVFGKISQLIASIRF